jgi:uncharacterized protein YhfF
MTWKRADGLRTIEFGTVGESRSTLLNFLLNGNKRATAGLLEFDYEADEPIEEIGDVMVVLGNHGEEVGRIRVTRVEVTNFADVPDEFALAEAEGDLSGDDFRQSHRAYWEAEGIEVKDDTQVVLVYFDLLQ